VSGFGSLELKKQGEFGLVCPYTAVFCPPRRDRTKRSQCRETEKVSPRAREREREREREWGTEGEEVTKTGGKGGKGFRNKTLARLRLFCQFQKLFTLISLWQEMYRTTLAR